MIAPVFLKEVETFLSIDWVEGHNICRINSVPQKLETHSWKHTPRIFINRTTCRKSDICSVCSLKDSSVIMATEINPLDLTYISNVMQLSAAASTPSPLTSTRLFVTLSVKHRENFPCDSIKNIRSRPRFFTLSNSLPDLVRLLLASLLNVLILIEFVFTVTFAFHGEIGR